MKSFNPATQLQNLAARQNLHYLSSRLLDAGASNDWYLFALDRRREMVVVWHAAFDMENELLIASELLTFDPSNTIPDCLIGEANDWRTWEDAIRADDNPYASYITQVGGAGNAH